MAPSVPVAEANSATASAQVPPVMPVNAAERVVVVDGDELQREPVGAESGDPGVGDGGGGPGPVGDRAGGAVLEDVCEGCAGVDVPEHVEAVVEVVAGRRDRDGAGGACRPADPQVLFGQGAARLGRSPASVRLEAVPARLAIPEMAL